MWKDEKAFENFDENARVWIYQANRRLNPKEKEHVEDEVNKFCNQWKAHGTQLAAKGSVLYDRFIVLAVDEKAEAASGCSIDTSVHLIKDLGQKMNIDFFDRLQVIYVDQDNNLSDFKSSEVNRLINADKIHEDSLVFNNMVLSVGELRKNWKRPLNETWLKRYL